MTVLADASAIVAMIIKEADSVTLRNTLDRHGERLYCATGAWEAARAVARIGVVDIVEASAVIDRWFDELGFRLVPIGETETRFAVDAHRRYGKGTRHPANLNMGDCFAYACAKANNATLLYKGDDFAKTDLA